MVNRGLLVRLEAKPGKEDDVEVLLQSAAAMVREERDTTAWFAVRFGRSAYGIFDAFADDAGRDAHLTGPVAKALAERGDALFAKPPELHKLDVLANKLPAKAPAKPDTKALLLTFRAKAGHEQEVESFMRGAQSIVEDEPQTVAWFAIHLDHGAYGIFDTFPGNGGRLAHLIGHVPRELAKHALSLLGSVPSTALPDVLAEKLVV